VHVHASLYHAKITFIADTLFQRVYLCQVSEQRKRKSGDRIAASQASPFPDLAHVSGKTSINHTSRLFKHGVRRHRTAHSTNPTFSSYWDRQQLSRTSESRTKESICNAKGLSGSKNLRNTSNKNTFRSLKRHDKYIQRRVSGNIRLRHDRPQDTNIYKPPEEVSNSPSILIFSFCIIYIFQIQS
jgi:hypothetical protein